MKTRGRSGRVEESTPGAARFGKWSYLNSCEKLVDKHTGQGLPAMGARTMQALLPMPDSTATVSPVNYIILQMKFPTNLRENFLNRTITPQLGE